ncbi:MAG: arginase [Bacteroidia bacterium]|jgi:arginase|nr:arginase [Bacteroidia bacterium]
MRADRFKVITVESDFGAGKKGAALGPQALLEQLQKRAFTSFDVFNYTRLVPQQIAPKEETPYGKNIENIKNFQEKIVEHIQDTLRLEKIPFILSGDHSSANALISGIKDFHANARIGVIWIDAHADLHSPYTTPSGNIHGMPIAALMGDDHREMAKNNPKEITRNFWETLKKLGRRRITPKIQGKDLVFIALRSTEEEEEKIITKEGIKAFRPEDIKHLGIEMVAEQTLNHLHNCQYIYISFDVDSLDTQYSQGTGTPVPDGLTIEQASYLLRTFCNSEKLVGMEITEINPLLDAENPMHEVIANLVLDTYGNA